LPHFANECIAQIKNIGENHWPSYDKKLVEDDEINFIIQINGKKRGIIKAKKGIKEQILFNKIQEEEKIFKYFINKEIRKKIFVKDKLINLII
jgi:leucyl-tRNA synthetase